MNKILLFLIIVIGGYALLTIIGFILVRSGSRFGNVVLGTAIKMDKSTDKLTDKLFRLKKKNGDRQHTRHNNKHL